MAIPMMSRFPCLALATLMLALTAPGCSEQDGEAGRDSETLVVYSAGPRALAEIVCEAYTEQTGTPVDLYSATTGQVMAKLDTEQSNPRADVVVLASRTAMEVLKHQDRLHRFQLADAEQTHTGWHDPDGAYWATAAASVGIATAKGVDVEGMGWTDLLQRFEGEMIMPAPSRSGSAADFVLTYTQHEPDASWSAFAEAKSRGLEIAGANSQAITNLLIGSDEVIVGAVDYLIYQRIAEGEPIEMHFPDEGVPIIARPAAVLATSDNKARAEDFISFYLSPAMQREVAALHLLPARKDTELSDVRRAAGAPEEMTMDLSEALASQQEVLQRFRQELE